MVRRSESGWATVPFIDSLKGCDEDSIAFRGVAPCGGPNRLISDFRFALTERQIRLSATYKVPDPGSKSTFGENAELIEP